MHQLNIQFHSDWAITSGEEAGAYADVNTLKDEHRLPYIPGKSLKGVLREAFETAVDGKWFGDQSSALLNALFGNEGAGQHGALQISSARLSPSEQQYFLQNPKHTKFLFRVVHSTKIDEQTGTAAQGSLRGMEVVVPLLLEAPLSLNTERLAQHNLSEKNALECLAAVLPLVTELGAKRTRGFGQVSISLAATAKQGA